jgi:hypothetical protein
MKYSWGSLFRIKNNTSDARDQDLLVRPKKQTDSWAVMGWWPNSACNAFMTDFWTVTWRRQILGPWRDWQEMGLPSWMVGQYVPSINENDWSAKTDSRAVMCHEWFLDCNVTTADSRAVKWPAKDGGWSGSMSGCMIVAWSLKDVFRRPWWTVWPDFEQGPYGWPEVVTQPCCSSNANESGPDTVYTAKRSNDQNLKSVSENWHSIYI